MSSPILYGYSTPFYNCCAYYILSSFCSEQLPGYIDAAKVGEYSLYVAAVQNGQHAGKIDIAKHLESLGWVRVKSAKSHHGSYDVHLYVSPMPNAKGTIEAFPVSSAKTSATRDSRGRFAKQRFKTGDTE